VLDLPLLARAGEEHAELGLGQRIALGTGRLEPERAEHELARPLQHPDERREHREERAHGHGDPEGRRFGVAERHALRHELAEDDVEVGEDEVREDHGDDRREPRLEGVRERLLAESTDTQRGERDAELHRRDEARRVRRDAQHVARAAVPLVMELDHPRPARGDERVLRRDEERVQQDQDGDADQFDRERHVSRPLRWGRRY
jgi:hypothetical protein